MLKYIKPSIVINSININDIVRTSIVVEKGDEYKPYPWSTDNFIN